MEKAAAEACRRRPEAANECLVESHGIVAAVIKKFAERTSARMRRHRRNRSHRGRKENYFFPLTHYCPVNIFGE